MLKRVHFILIFAVLAASVGILSGCQSSDTSKTGNNASESSAIHYTTEANMNELDYKMFIGERITNTQMLIHARMSVSKNLASKEYPTGDEIKNTESAIEKIQKYIDEISVTRPPKERFDDQEQILQNLTNAKETMQVYLDYLKKGDLDKAQDSAAVMKGDYDTLGTLGI